jgi:ketosteroid isomerase-like protein
MTHPQGRRSAVLTTAMLALALLGSTVSRAHASRSDSQVLLDDEQAWAQAAVVGDADKMASFMADDYLELAWEPAADGKPAHWNAGRKAEWVESVRSHKDVYTSVELHNLTVHVQGNLAAVTGEYSQKGTSGGKDISASGIYENTWVKRDGRWLLVHSVFP